MDKYMAIALWLINEANSDKPLQPKTEYVARYLEQLATSAMEHAYPINHWVEGMPLYHEVFSSFTPPLPKEGGKS